MKKTFIVVCLLISTIACFSQELKKYKAPKQDAECKRVFNVTKNTDGVSTSIKLYTRVVYRSYDDLLADLEKKRDQSILSQDEFKAKKDTLPRGGAITIYTKRGTLKGGDTKNLKVVLKDKSGNELVRIVCQPQQANIVFETLGNPTYYTNSAVVNLTTALKGNEFDLLVIDEALNNLRYEYIIKLGEIVKPVKPKNEE